MNVRVALLASAVLAPLALEAADWPQWRGPLRNGVAPESPRLLDAWPKGELRQIWDSEEIPSNDAGGLGSPIIAAGSVFLSLVWHRDVPSETRQIDELVLRKLGHQPLDVLGPELVAKMEETRGSLSPTLRGKKLEEFSEQWIAANLDKKQTQFYSGYVQNRFKRGPLALPIEALDKLAAEQKRVFASDAELRAWLDAEGFSDEVKKQVIEAVPPTQRAAEDTVICLDFATGRTRWKTTAPGEKTGVNASSTPAFADGKLYALGSVAVSCADAVTGRQVWTAPLPQKAPSSSPLVVDGMVVINARHLFALDAATGRELWKQGKAGGGNSSPVAWSSGGRTLIICNGSKALDAVDAATGKLLWNVPGSGDSTPAIAGDLLAVQSHRKELGLLVYRLKADGAEKLWNVPFDAARSQASPLLHDGSVFLVDNDVQTCFDSANGSQRWSATVPGSIASPVLADGKFLVLTNNGNNVQMLRADGAAARAELGKANVKAAWVPSPAIADGRLVLRLKDRLRCYSLAD